LAAAARIRVRGIVQGVGYRPFVYKTASELGISGTVQNLGSEVLIIASGEKLSEFIALVSQGPLRARIEDVIIEDLTSSPFDGFKIIPSEEGVRSGSIPPDIATCAACIDDIHTKGSRYQGYWATSCVDCGPRYSIINSIPYDRERTTMKSFQVCESCGCEYGNPQSRRHHAQTIACEVCGPELSLLDMDGSSIDCSDPLKETAKLLDEGMIVALKGVGGFHIACSEEMVPTLKARLGRSEQAFAIMARPDYLKELAEISQYEKKSLYSPKRPIVVLKKRNPASHSNVSNLHTIGCMLPYTGFHHLLFSYISHPFLIMTSANVPGHPMITGTKQAVEKLHGKADYFLTHNRPIANRCDDSVIRDGFIIRLSRGYTPKRKRIDLGPKCILGAGPELNSNITIYKDGFCTTSPHIGNVSNPSTYSYLKETIEKMRELLGSGFQTIAHDAHPRFLSTRYSYEIADGLGAELVPVQHHHAHIAAVTDKPCIGIALDGVGYGDDGTVWGGEIFSGELPDFKRVAHLEVVPMPGGDLATRYPERMLYGILQSEEILTLMKERGISETECSVIANQVRKGVNVAYTSSTGRVLDAVSALLGICRERAYDGEPAMKLESAGFGIEPDDWERVYLKDGNMDVFSTKALCREAYLRVSQPGRIEPIAKIASSFQYNLAKGVASLALNAADDFGTNTIAMSGGVLYNQIIRKTLLSVLKTAGMECLFNFEYPLGDGCISFGQCRYAGTLQK